MKYAIQISGLRKNYGSTEVLKGIDFQVKKGEIFGILGVNGAGKTTTLECIEGFRGYDSGEISVDGKIGIQLQSASLPHTSKQGRLCACLQSGIMPRRIRQDCQRWVYRSLRRNDIWNCLRGRSAACIWRWL